MILHSKTDKTMNVESEEMICLQISLRKTLHCPSKRIRRQEYLTTLQVIKGRHW